MNLPPGANSIPAMTTQAEREAYYKLASECRLGAVIEMGAWLGASTVYIAAGVRDSGSRHRLHVYDRWVWDPSHSRKVNSWNTDHPEAGYRDRPMPNRASMFGVFQDNLGDLIDYVDIHQGEIWEARWQEGSIGLMILDAPKRCREIGRALSVFGPNLIPGAKMAWQDFAHFPSYEIVACLHRLRDYVDFEFGVAPGTTAIFKVQKRIPPSAVTDAKLALGSWTPGEIKTVWQDYAAKLPEYMRARFRCGAALFLCDIGHGAEGQKVLREIVKSAADEIMPKWHYLWQQRANLVNRYRPLFSELAF